MDATGFISSALFASRRHPEIKDVLSSMREQPSLSGRCLRSGGCKTSSRHLRRRATSHLPRKRNLNASQHPSNVTGSSRKSKRQRRDYLKVLHHQSREETTDWIPTHLWHVKRFHMITAWNWRVPLIHCGRGTNATFRLLREHCLIQDLSWRMRPFRISVEMNTSSLLKRIIPSFGLSGTSSFGMMRYAVFHTIDSCPQSAIGPLCWVEGLGTTELSRNGTNQLHIFVHPAITNVLERLLRELGIDISSNIDVSCLSLIGKESTLELLRQPTDQNVQMIKSEPSGGLVEEYFLFGPESAISNIFIDLSHKGACPIGEMDRIGLSIEYLGKKHFPRDFPDTEQGRLFWENASEWSSIRPYVGQQGRCKKPKTRAIPSLHIPACVGYDDNCVVVVRDDYLAPFHALAHALTSHCGNLEEGGSHDRLVSIDVPQNVCQDISSFCQNLLSTLSLPAVLMVEVSVEGRGNPSSGSSILYNGRSIGFATALEFSRVSGCVKGLCVVNALELLRMLDSVAVAGVVAVRRGVVCLPVSIQETESDSICIGSLCLRF